MLMQRIYISALNDYKNLLWVHRAVYSRADIYLLDDPLSAVDATVAKHLVDNCIRGLLKDKCVLLITHQLNFFSPDTPLLLLDNGRVTQSGRMEELQSGIDTSSPQDTTLDSLVTDDQTDWIDRSGDPVARYTISRLVSTISEIQCLIVFRCWFQK